MRISDWSSDVCSSDLNKRRWQAQLPGVQPDLAVDRPVAGDMAAFGHEGQRQQPVGEAFSRGNTLAGRPGPALFADGAAQRLCVRGSSSVAHARSDALRWGKEWVVLVRPWGCAG